MRTERWGWIIFVSLLVVIGIAPVVYIFSEQGDDNVIFTTEASSVFGDSIFVSNDVIFGPVTIDLETGNITIEEGVSMDAAARKFWRILEDVYPMMFEGGRKR